MEILIGGDLMISKSNEYLFCNKKIDVLLGKELYDYWKRAKYKIFNLESPLCNNNFPIKKEGALLRGCESSINGIAALNPSLVGLANNHIMDQGNEGCKKTMELLTKYGIPYVGVGKNVDSVKKFHVISDGNMKIGVFACCETEFSGATTFGYGANLYDEFTSFDDIKKLKEDCDKVIVLYHGGKEHYRYPSPRLQILCRKFVDSGSDLVVVQHTHCIGCMEEYHDSKIIYGQGNFVFDFEDNEYSQTGLLLKVTFDNNVDIEYIPILKCNEKIKMLDKNGLEYRQIMNDFFERSKQIQNEKFVIENYNLFAAKKLENYFYNITHKSLIFKIINKLLKKRLINNLYNNQDCIHILNAIQCESHRELFVQGLKNRIGANNKR